MASTEKNKNKKKPNDETPTNLSKHNFLYKALTLTLFLIILPLFPSQAPEYFTFVNNQTLFTTTWELFHLLFVGIAISYGLFSRRNDHINNINNANSQFLHVSSVFDDEEDEETEEEDRTNNNNNNNNKVIDQSWNSQYRRGGDEPVVVEKPLLLPVRSLKETSTNVLPSPIPWRSRSGRLDVKAESLLSTSNDQPKMDNNNNNNNNSNSNKKKSLLFYDKSVPPPPPPPPPPTFYYSRRISSSVSPEKILEIPKASLEESETEESESEEEEEEDGFVVDRRESVDSVNDNKGSFGGGDVDKKADEFIAKFREQIRLQRIESIKRSTAQMSKNMSR